MSELRVAIVNPPALDGSIFMKELGRCGRRSAGGERWPQTGLAHLAAVADEAGAEVLLFDPMAEGVAFADAARRVLAISPDLVLLHAATPTFVGDARFAALLNEGGAPLVGLVGYHPTVLPRQSLDESVADLLFVGEVEVPLAALIARMMAGGRGGELAEPPVAGLLWRGVEIEDALLEPQLVDRLDSLPLPRREGLPVTRYRMPFFGREPFTTVIPTRGCPYQCTF